VAALEMDVVVVDVQVALELAFPQADMTFVAFAESGDELVNTQKKNGGSHHCLLNDYIILCKDLKNFILLV